mgnify:CR=1 FL=1
MSQPTEPRTTRPTDQRPTLSRRHALGGVAGVGLGLPLLAACGGAADRPEPAATTPDLDSVDAAHWGDLRCGPGEEEFVCDV